MLDPEQIGECVVEDVGGRQSVTRADAFALLSDDLVRQLTGWDSGYRGPVAMGTHELGLGEVVYAYAGRGPEGSSIYGRTH